MTTTMNEKFEVGSTIWVIDDANLKAEPIKVTEVNGNIVRVSKEDLEKVFKPEAFLVDPADVKYEINEDFGPSIISTKDIDTRVARNNAYTSYDLAKAELRTSARATLASIKEKYGAKPFLKK